MEMADGLERLYRDAALRQQLKAAGLRRARMYSWENAAAILYNVYREALGE
jgi:glycosyltransferase involved in cell wall biosynthesis